MSSSDKTLADRTYRQLRGDIVNGRLAAGSKLKLAGQYSGATLWKRATNEWALIGDIVT